MGCYWESRWEFFLKNSIQFLQFLEVDWNEIVLQTLSSSPWKSLMFLSCVHVSGIAIAQHHTLWYLLHAAICAKRSHSPEVRYLFQTAAVPPSPCFHQADGHSACCSQKLPVLAGATLSDPISYERKPFVELLCSAVAKLNLLHTWLSFTTQRIRLLKVCWSQMCEQDHKNM